MEFIDQVATVDLVGPFIGSLGDSYGRVTLQTPDASPVDHPTVMPRVVDDVLYDDLIRWPTPPKLANVPHLLT